MLLSALENNCKSPVRTFLVILRNPLWSSSAANCSPIATNDVRDKEQQLLDTWLCESVFFKACPQSCGQAVTLNIPFVWAHFWGIGALGLAGLKQFVPSLDLRVEHCGERGREQALPHCVTLGSSRAALSFCSQLCAAASLCFLSALQANGFYWDSLLVRNLCRASVCCLNQSEGGGVASILPEHFSLPGASCPSLCLSEMEHLSSGQPWCGQGAQGSSLWVIHEVILQGFSPFSLLPLPEVICHLGFCPCLPGPSWILAELCSGVLPSQGLSLCTAKGSKDWTVRQIQTTLQWNREDFGLKCSRICTVRSLIFPYPW